MITRNKLVVMCSLAVRKEVINLCQVQEKKFELKTLTIQTRNDKQLFHFS
jgi:hypothetical protein